MPTFAASDGTRLAHHGRGEGPPLLCLPGGPMRASAYLGDLGGLTRHRRLCLLDLRGTGASDRPADPATYRCDRQVDDVEAFRAHLGLDRVDLLAHSAGGDLALLYAVRHPERVRSLTLVAARARALGVDFTPEHRAEGAALRAGEPWFEGAHAAYGRIWAGTASDADFDAATPFFYGRWDAAARAHAATDLDQTNEEAADRYATPDAFRPAAAGPWWPPGTCGCCSSRARWTAARCHASPRPSRTSSRGPRRPSCRGPGTSRGSTNRDSSRTRSRVSSAVRVSGRGLLRTLRTCRTCLREEGVE